MPAERRAHPLLYAVLAITVIMIVIAGRLTVALQLFFHLALGWVFFTMEVIPAITVHWPSVVTGVIAFFFVLFGIHSAIRWCERQKVFGESNGRVRWRLLWSLYAALLVVIAFIAGIAVTGLIHQFYWLFRDAAAYRLVG